MNNNRGSLRQVRRSRSKSNSRSKRGVSPVIGVILMVAATIVIAGVVMAMLGGFKAPQTGIDMSFTSVSASATTNKVTATVLGADATNVPTTSLIATMDLNGAGHEKATIALVADVDGDTKIDAGDVISIAPTSLSISAGDQVHVVITHKDTGAVVGDITIRAVA